MLTLIAFCLLFVTCAFTASGAAKLFLMLIEPGEMFSGWDKVLMKICPEKGDKNYLIRDFWYRRLGGCEKCTRQLFAEISFVAFCLLFTAYAPFPTSELNIIVKWALNAVIFVGFCGTSLQISDLMKTKPKEREEEKIIETKYYN